MYRPRLVAVYFGRFPRGTGVDSIAVVMGLILDVRAGAVGVFGVKQYLLEQLYVKMEILSNRTCLRKTHNGGTLSNDIERVTALGLDAPA